MRNGERSQSVRAQRAAHDQAADINDKLIINLRDLSHTMRSLYEGKGSQRRILIVLNEIGAISQQALTKRLCIQPGSASEVIAKLEGAGLITRTPNEADRRTADITLTERGKELAVQAAEQRSHRHAEMFACLSADEKAQLLSLLETVNADWEQRYRPLGKQSGRSGPHHGRHGHHAGAQLPETEI